MNTRMNDKEIEARWNREAAECLLGRTVVEARYMTEAEAENYCWDDRPVMIRFDNGLVLIPSSDDEGNNGGAIFLEWNGVGNKGDQLFFPTSHDEKAGSEILPVLR